MPRLKESTRAARRDHLLDAAARAFARLGSQRATMADILGEARISAGAAYLYFRSKDELIAALAARSSARDGRVIAACARPGDPAGTIAAILDLALADWRVPGARDDVRLDVAWWAEALGNPRVARVLRRSAHAAIAALAAALGGAARAREARVLTALLLGLMVQWHLDPALDPSNVQGELRRAAAALARRPKNRRSR